MYQYNKKANIVLTEILYIHYLLCFCKNKNNKIQILIYFYSKINTIILVYILKLDLKICYISAKAQKIDNSIFKIIKMIQTSFLKKNKFKKVRFF